MTQLLQTGDGSAAADQARAQGRPSPHPSVHLLHKRIQLLQLLHHTGEERNAPQAHYPPQDATSPVTIFCHLGVGGSLLPDRGTSPSSCSSPLLWGPGKRRRTPLGLRAPGGRPDTHGAPTLPPPPAYPDPEQSGAKSYGPETQFSESWDSVPIMNIVSICPQRNSLFQLSQDYQASTRTLPHRFSTRS